MKIEFYTLVGDFLYIALWIYAIKLCREKSPMSLSDQMKAIREAAKEYDQHLKEEKNHNITKNDNTDDDLFMNDIL